jgi:hypothetical protein
MLLPDPLWSASPEATNLAWLFPRLLDPETTNRTTVPTFFRPALAPPPGSSRAALTSFGVFSPTARGFRTSSPKASALRAPLMVPPKKKDNHGQVHFLTNRSSTFLALAFPFGLFPWPFHSLWLGRNYLRLSAPSQAEPSSFQRTKVP